MMNGGYNFNRLPDSENIKSNSMLIDKNCIELKKILSKIKNRVLDKDIKMPITHNDLTKDFMYSELKTDEYFVHNKNCHVGQRKLLLTEILYYNIYLPKLDDVIVVYAGSADGHHTPIILDMFPNIKLLMIDPNYHDIKDVCYIYQNKDVINKTVLERFLKLDKKQPDFKFRETEFLIDGKKRDILNPDPKDDWIKKDFQERNYLDLIDKIKESDKRVFIIQDYCRLELCKTLKKSFDQVSEKIYFLSDIRTTVVKNTANDLDIVWNYALQIGFLKELKPEVSMLKFRPYFMTDQNDDDILNREDGFIKSIKDDINKVKHLYGKDMLKDYLNNKCNYFQAEEIYIQPWAPISSTESRMIVMKDKIDAKFVNYDHKDWEDQFYTLNRWKNYKPLNIFYDKIKDNRVLRYDRCYDCGLEIAILINYFNNIDIKDINKLKKSLNPKTIQDIELIYKKIDRISNTDFTKSMKCLLPHKNFLNGCTDIYIKKNTETDLYIKFTYCEETKKIEYSGQVKLYNMKY